MKILFEKLMWHQEDYEKYEKQKELINNGEYFMGYFWSKVLIDIDLITTHFENPTYVNSKIINCTEVIMEDGSRFLINVVYREFLKFLREYEKPRNFSEAVKLFNG